MNSDTVFCHSVTYSKHREHCCKSEFNPVQIGFCHTFSLQSVFQFQKFSLLLSILVQWEPQRVNRLNYIYYKRKSHYLLQYKPPGATKYHFFMSCKLIKFYPHSDTRHCYKSKTYFLPGDIFLPSFFFLSN